MLPEQAGRQPTAQRVLPVELADRAERAVSTAHKPNADQGCAGNDWHRRGSATNPARPDAAQSRANSSTHLAAPRHGSGAICA